MEINRVIKTTSFKASLLLLLLGVALLILENLYYGYVDANGVVRESVSLPFGLACLFLGTAGLLLTLIRFFFKTRQW